MPVRIGRRRHGDAPGEVSARRQPDYNESVADLCCSTCPGSVVGVAYVVLLGHISASQRSSFSYSYCYSWSPSSPEGAEDPSSSSPIAADYGQRIPSQSRRSRPLIDQDPARLGTTTKMASWWSSGRSHIPGRMLLRSHCGLIAQFCERPGHRV